MACKGGLQESLTYIQVTWKVALKSTSAHQPIIKIADLKWEHHAEPMWEFTHTDVEHILSTFEIRGTHSSDMDSFSALST